MFLDFSPVGWKAGVKEFLLSVLKTAVAAAIAFAIARLSEYHIPTDSIHATEIVAAVGLLRAVLTSLSKWITTSQANAVVVG